MTTSLRITRSTATILLAFSISCTGGTGGDSAAPAPLGDDDSPVCETPDCGPPPEQLCGDVPCSCDNPLETTAPVIETVRIDDEQGYLSGVEIVEADYTTVLPEPTTVTILVQTSDDHTELADLTVEAYDPASGTAITPDSRILEYGLWEMTLVAQPGLDLKVRVTDEFCNTSVSTGALALPSHAEGAATPWQVHYYEPDQTNLRVEYLEFAADGAWSSNGPDTVEASAGVWEFHGDQLTVDRRTYAGPKHVEDADPATVESETTAGYYLDDFYFFIAPFRSAEPGEHLVGEWNRVYRVVDYVAGTDHTIEETLALTSGGEFSESRMVLDGGGALVSQSSSAGTFTIVLNANYVLNPGDFLQRTVESRDGVTLAVPEEMFEMYAIRAGRLGILPLVHL